MKNILLFILSILFLSCAQSTPTHVSDNIMHYSRLLQLSEGGNATIINPWDTTSVLQHYTITVPVRRAVVFISSHCSLLDELGLHDFYTDMSADVTPNIERIIQLQPDIILVSPFENSGGNGLLDRLNIPIIQCADYMEETPLARAEWMRFYARLFGKDADSLFSKIEQDYTHLKKSTSQTSRPKVILDLIYGNTWYMPGGHSTIANLINDAGGDYIFADNTETGSLSLSPEAVLQQGIDADVWLLRYGQDIDLTYRSLASQHPFYSRIKAFKKKKIYGCNLNHVPFFEECPFHPERLLRNLQSVFSIIDTDSINTNDYFTPLYEN